MLTNSLAQQIVLKTETQILNLDRLNGAIDNKISIKDFNIFAESNGLQKIEGRSDTEKIDVATIKEQMLEKYCEKYPQIADKIKAYAKEKSEYPKELEGFEKLEQKEIKPSEQQFGL